MTIVSKSPQDGSSSKNRKLARISVPPLCVTNITLQRSFRKMHIRSLAGIHRVKKRPNLSDQQWKRILYQLMGQKHKDV